MNPSDPLFLTRRHFFSRLTMGLGGAALAHLLPKPGLLGAEAAVPAIPAPHFAPKAKRIIYLFMSGGPAQQDLFDYKPLLNQRNGEPLPPEVRGVQRLTGMSANQAALPLAGSHFKFAQHGQSGAWMSELLPKLSGVSDELCIIKCMWTEALNHDPAITFFPDWITDRGPASIGSLG
jgi:hypothetical protein